MEAVIIFCVVSLVGYIIWSIYDYRRDIKALNQRYIEECNRIDALEERLLNN